LNAVVGTLALAAVALVVLLSVRIVQSLVVDSQIPFDVGRFYTANEYTAWGFATLGVLGAGTALAVKVLTEAAAALLPQPVLRYGILLALALGVAFWFFPGIGPAPLLVAVAVWTLLFTALLERPQPLAFTVASAPRIVTGMVVLALSMGSLLHYFLLQRTYKKDMVAFAERIVGQEDHLLHYTLSNALQSLTTDPDVREFLSNPTPERRPLLDARLEVLYLSKNLTGYTPRLHFFNAGGQPLYNRDTISQAYFDDRIAFSMPKGVDGLFYTPTATDGHHYTARVRVDDTGGRLGTVYIDLALRRTVAETVYPELLQPEAVHGASGGQSYPYAVYTGGLPVTQTEDYPFPEAVAVTHGQTGATYRRRYGRDELWYTDAGDRVAIVVGPRNRLLDSAALFSYLFAVMVVLAIVAIGYRAVLKWSGPERGFFPGRVPRLSLRQGIHLSMLGLVLVSLVGVGVVTVALFNARYRETTDMRLRNTVSVIARSLRQSASWKQASGPEQIDSIARGPRIRYRLAAISEAQKADVSLFGTDGILLASSQDEIYNRGLLPRQMRPDAFHALRKGQPVVLQRERVGRFTYQSAYVPLRGDEGNVLGYVNVPFFSSEKELSDQISGILVTLVNLYAVLFLLAGGLAYLITRGLTRTLAVITTRFRQLSLHRNEILEWPYDDEIGLLVREYNKMVRELEQSAASLVRSEREGAWREMARQVAHEIKNPLTPMKLQIQYLQRALKDGRPDMPQLAERVSGTLVEQIDNLSRIATEFSDFARLPEARPQVLELGPLLQRTADLHRAEGRVDISVETPPSTVVVRADHSHLLRAFTNLVQNAVQAIPEDRAARIRIRLQAGERVATVSIADNGRGISASERARIFRPYFTTKSSGTGLGLAMTRQMVEGWGGRIWFESREGEGTEFFVEVPLAAEEV
jgi:signal transduction histidine kinase